MDRIIECFRCCFRRRGDCQKSAGEVIEWTNEASRSREKQPDEPGKEVIELTNEASRRGSREKQSDEPVKEDSVITDSYPAPIVK